MEFPHSVPRRSRLRLLLVAVGIGLLAVRLFAATFGLAPNSLQFPAQQVGSESNYLPVTVSVPARAKAPLQFTVSITNGHVNDFRAESQCGGFVPIGGSCEIRVWFRPTATGNRSAWLNVGDDAKASNSAKMKISGVGVVPPTVAPSSLDFGWVATNATSAPQSVTVTNPQSSTLTVTSLTTTNSDYTATGCTAPIPAGGTCAVAVRFRPTAAANTTENATLSIAHSGLGPPLTVSLTGISVTPFELDPTTVGFPDTFQGASHSSTITVRNNQSAPTSVTASVAPPFNVTGCSAPIPGRGSCQLTVNFSPVLVHAGPMNGTLSVGSTTPAVHTSTANLSGVALIPVTVAPATLNFGGVTVASTSLPLEVTLTNHQPTMLTFGVPRVSFSGAAAGDFAEGPSSCGPTLAGGASCTIGVTFHPTVGGARAAALSIDTNAFNSPHIVSLSGTGTTPLTISPSSLTFGDTNVGLASASQLVTVQNNQSIPAALTALTFNGDFAQTQAGTTCGATIPALQSCVIAVVATPTQAGARIGSLVITSDTSESPNTLALSVTGVNGMTVSVPSLTFAPQQVNTTSSPQQIVVTNHQSIAAALGTVVTGDFAATNACGGTVPALSTCAIAVTFTPTAVGPRVGSVTVNNPGSAPWVVTLQGVGAEAGAPAAVLDVDPGVGTIGTTVLGVLVTGNETTNFNLSSGVDFGAGVTVSNLRNVSAHALTVDVAIGANAVPGPRTVTVTTPLGGDGTEVASLVSGFIVSASADLALASIAPDSAAQGQTVSVAIVGTDTHFQQGVTFATFGSGTTVTSFTVQDQTHATADVLVSPTTALGWRTVSVVTGGEIASIVPAGSSGPGFNVVVGPAHLTSITPASGAQGSVPFVVTIVGDGTHFLQGASAVSFGDGILVGNIQVAGPTQLTVSIAVSAGAAIGARTVTVTTGGEVASLAEGFTVTAAPPASLTSVSPNNGQQGDSFSITLVGSNTHFTTDVPAPTLTLGSNITVSPLVVVDDTTITASVSIDPLAFTGARQGTLSSGGTNYPFAFTVNASAASISAITPPTGPQGGVVTVTVNGTGTHWQQGSTTAAFLPGSCLAPTVNAITVNSATQATLTISIPAGACVGSHVLQLSTGGEILSTSFGVYAQTPTLTLGPGNGMVGTSPTINLLGEFTHFGPETTAIIDGTGVAINGFTVTSPGSATAQFVIAAGAATGARTVTLTTPLGGGAFEVVSTAFVVSDTPATLTSVQPFHSARGVQTLVTVTGQFTHFGPTTTVGLGPDIQVGPPTILSPTELTVLVEVAPDAATGWRSLFINTGSEQLTAGFRIDGEAAPSLLSVAPSSAVQGQSLTVSITGAPTSFNQTSQLILGAGVTVSDFVVTSPTTATATVAVSETAPIGPNTVLVITETAPGQSEIASGAGFDVRRGPANILSVAPNIAAQNQILNVSIVGQGTHWLQGGTTASFGPGIAVAQLTIHDATHATAQIVVLSTAAAGFHTATMITDGEVATLDQAIDVQQGTPVLLSSTPNSGAQGTSFTVTALGSLTHWVQGETTASYGAGVAVTGVTVIDSVSAVLNVTIDPLAFTNSCRTLTVTTGTEQVSLPAQLCVQPGAAVLTSVSPNAALQGSTLTVHVVGQNTNFIVGLTEASFGDGINTSNVTVTSPTTASVDLAVSTQAASGFRTATLTTLGESASLALAFNVGQNTPTLNVAAPFSGQRGQSLTVRLLGQYTHWAQPTTTVTFGEGILVGPVTVVNATTVDVPIEIDALATLGGRSVTVTTGGEIVTAQVFSVVPGGASITSVSPQSGNQGQQLALTITGQNTNWQQGFTQFAVVGAGNDVTVNFVVVNSPTSATVGLTLAPGATPGPRSIFMITGPEALVRAGGFVVTGGVPAIGSISPASVRAGDADVNVEVTGLYTEWLTGTTTVDFGPGIVVSNVVVGNDARITAVISVDPAAALGFRTVVVRNVNAGGTQALTGSFQVVSPQPPAPSLQYVSPNTGLRGQTFTINVSAANTHFDPTPGATEVDFGDPQTAGIQVNTFQVTSPTTARINITIANDAAVGTRTLSIVTHTDSGDEIVQGAFTVVQATPQLTIVDPGTGMQGATIDVTLVGTFTGFNESTTFDFGDGISIIDDQVFGAAVAQVRVAIDELAATGPRFITATTGTEVVTALFSVTPSTAVITSVAPNTAKQGQSVVVAVVGQNTNWSGSTIFNFGNGVSVTGGTVDSLTQTATLTLQVDALATVGAHTVTASTGGELAALVNGFVVQPGTPLILSSSPSGGLQQASVTLTILGQATAWDATTEVDLGAGIDVLTVQPTSATALTVGAVVQPLALLGPRMLTVTTGAQVLTLANAFNVLKGPAAIGQLSPNESGQGVTLNVVVTGVNTNFVDGITQASFGDGVTVNSTTVQSPTSATVNVTVATDAQPGQRTVSLVTPGETATILNGFTIQQTDPEIVFVSPDNGAQGATLDVTVFGALTNFTNETVFDFGPGVTVEDVAAVSATQATVTVKVSPVAALTTRNVSATNGTGPTVIGGNLFTVTPGPAYISAINPAVGVLGQVGLQVTISGFETHFTAGTPVVSLGPGVTVTNVIVDTDTQLRASVTIDPQAPVQANDVVVTTLGEVAALVGGFTVQRPFVSSVAPTSAYQEQTLDVTVTGVHTHFVASDTLASFGPGVIVNSVTVVSPTQATLNVTVQLAATPGVRTVTMTTGLESASGAGMFTVLAKETPVITWAPPADIVYGTALGATQLNATADTDGTFLYAPATGTVLSAGNAQVLQVTFTPTNTVRYFTAVKTVLINVAKANQPALTVNAPASAVYQSSFLVTTSGGATDGIGIVTFQVSGVCSNVNGGATITMTGGTGVCSVTATKAGDNNYFPVTSAAVDVAAEKAAQAALTIVDPPSSIPNGETFQVLVAGGSSSGAVTLSVTGPCVNDGLNVTITGSTGACMIVATKAADDNFLEISSPAVFVGASGPVPPVFDILPSTAALSFYQGASPPGTVSVRLAVNGVNVQAPAGGVTVLASSDNTACVTTTNGSIAGGSYVGSIGIAYGHAPRPCSALVTATTAGYGSDVVTVTVYEYADAPFTGTGTSVSYYNPALLPNPAGSVATSVASVSYYNPAVLASPTGSIAASVASVSYYNPALLPSPTGSLVSSVASASYYNPAMLPSPTDAVNTNAFSVSYQNGPDDDGQGASLQTMAAALIQTDPVEPAATVTSVSVANGPTAGRVRPTRLIRSVAAAYTLRIDGANLADALKVSLAGLDQYVIVLPPVSSADGTQLTVQVLVAPDTPLGVVPVIVEGPGWVTPDVPGMRVEIAP